jgi:hypothetical protein
MDADGAEIEMPRVKSRLIHTLVYNLECCISESLECGDMTEVDTFVSRCEGTVS